MPEAPTAKPYLNFAELLAGWLACWLARPQTAANSRYIVASRRKAPNNLRKTLETEPNTPSTNKHHPTSQTGATPSKKTATMSVRLSPPTPKPHHPTKLTPLPVRPPQPPPHAAIPRGRRRAHPPQVGPDGIHRAPGERRQLHERAAVRRGGVD